MNQQSNKPLLESFQDQQLPYFTLYDAEKGWYWGEAKRPGTPSNWVLEAQGTRGARWIAPEVK